MLNRFFSGSIISNKSLGFILHPAPNDSDSILRRFLIEFGHEERVREELIGNTYNECYTGPSSVHYQNKKDEVQEIKEKEEEYNVNRWLDELSESLDRMIEESKIREEKMDP